MQWHGLAQAAPGARTQQPPPQRPGTEKPAVSSGFPEALFRTRTGDPFLTIDRRGGDAGARAGEGGHEGPAQMRLSESAG
jgi:hypothetical protein